MGLFARLGLLAMLFSVIAYLPYGYEKIRQFEAEEDKKSCLYGTTCWNDLSFEGKLKMQKIWRSGGIAKEF